MIEKMKKVSVFTTSAHKNEMLEQLRSLGILHIAESKEADPALVEKYTSILNLRIELKEFSDGKTEKAELLEDEEFEAVFSNARENLAMRKELLSKRSRTVFEIEKIRAWGDFSPSELSSLKNVGLDFHIYRIDKKEMKKLEASEDIKYILLAPVEKQITVAVLGEIGDGIQAIEFTLPQKGIGELEQEIKALDEEILSCENVLRKAALYSDSYRDQLIKIKDKLTYSSAERTAENESGIVWLTGYIPADCEQSFESAAQANRWAWSSEDASESDEFVPTKIKYNKLTKIIEPIFDLLGTVPGYAEYDISFWFLAFFTLFVAMIIGDAGYGLLILIATGVLTLKSRKLTNLNMLLFVLSSATVVWGSLTGTWFGAEAAMKIPFLRSLVIPGFANYPEYFNVTTSAAQNNVMKFCFTIGVIQLSLACIMSIRRKVGRKDLSWLADLGWLCSICSLYFLVLFLVIGQDVNVKMIFGIVIAGFLLVCFFGGMSPDKSFAAGLKAGLGGFFTTFLNTISAFGNVMSYIRLFAVGMASIAIAQSFNDMAAGLKGPLVVAAVVILVIGHALNIIMGFLSVMVHGVRLNLLEFSGQLGMEWTGTAYNPFKKQDKIKK